MKTTIPKTNAFNFLAHETEQIEYQQAVEGLGLLLAQQEASKRKQVVLLKRTFNQKMWNQAGETGEVMKFWRIIGPESHPNYHSDLSLQGLKEWGII